MTAKILLAIRSSLDLDQEAGRDLTYARSARFSRKSLGQVLSATPGNVYNGSFSKVFGSSLARLNRGGYLEFINKDHFTITDKGRDLLLKFNIDDVRLADFEAAGWDGYWRILLFDIPELNRTLRDVFRMKLQELGFLTIQKSVYVIPQPCQKEIFIFAKLLKISRNIRIIETKSLGQDDPRARNHFGLL